MSEAIFTFVGVLVGSGICIMAFLLGGDNDNWPRKRF